MQDIYERIGTLWIVPVIAIEDLDAALPLADALAEGGLPAAEITFRTKAAAIGGDRTLLEGIGGPDLQETDWRRPTLR